MLSRAYLINFFKGCHPQVLLCPFLNTLSHFLSLDVAFKDMKPHFSQEKRSHCKRCWLIPEVDIEH